MSTARQAAVSLDARGQQAAARSARPVLIPIAGLLGFLATLYSARHGGFDAEFSLALAIVTGLTLATSVIPISIRYHGPYLDSVSPVAIRSLAFGVYFGLSTIVAVYDPLYLINQHALQWFPTGALAGWLALLGLQLGYYWIRRRPSAAPEYRPPWRDTALFVALLALAAGWLYIVLVLMPPMTGEFFRHAKGAGEISLREGGKLPTAYWTAIEVEHLIPPLALLLLLRRRRTHPPGVPIVLLLLMVSPLALELVRSLRQAVLGLGVVIVVMAVLLRLRINWRRWAVALIPAAIALNLVAVRMRVVAVRETTLRERNEAALFVERVLPATVQSLGEEETMPDYWATLRADAAYRWTGVPVVAAMAEAKAATGAEYGLGRIGLGQLAAAAPRFFFPAKEEVRARLSENVVELRLSESPLGQSPDPFREEALVGYQEGGLLGVVILSLLCGTFLRVLYEYLVVRRRLGDVGLAVYGAYAYHVFVLDEGTLGLFAGLRVLLPLGFVLALIAPSPRIRRAAASVTRRFRAPRQNGSDGPGHGPSAGTPTAPPVETPESASEPDESAG